MKHNVKPWPSIYRRVYWTGREKWVVDAGLVQGRRWRRAFDSLPEAKTQAERLRVERQNEGRAALGLSPAQRQEAAACVVKLEVYGATLTEATDYYVEHVLRYQVAPVVQDLIAQLVAEKREQGLRPAALGSLRSFCRLLERQHGPRRLHEITQAELNHLCRGQDLAPRTVWNRIQLARQVWNFAIDRGWTGANLADKIAVPPREDREPGYLAVVDARRLLQVASEYDLLGYVALGLFAGLRAPNSHGWTGAPCTGTTARLWWTPG